MIRSPSTRLANILAASLGRVVVSVPLLLPLGLVAGDMGAAAAASDTSAGEAVLLVSTAPGYAPGMVIATHDRLVLPDGAAATLLFRSGEMLRVRGPFEGSLDHLRPQSQDASVAVLAELLRMQGVDASAIGGTRTAALGSTATERSRTAIEDVLVDPQRSATYCVQTTDYLWIGRPGDGGGPYALRRKGTARTIAWPPGAARIPWPDDVPVEDGDRFELLDNGTARAVLSFRRIGGRFASDAAWIAAGILSGCRGQFDAKLRGLAHGNVPAELWLTSDRGRTPSYRPGEPISLTARSDTDGYLYCASIRGDGSTETIFPAGGARVRETIPVAVPGGDTVGLRAGPRGMEQIRCWMADHDISRELPRALFDPMPARLPGPRVADLEAAFANVAGSGMPQATLNISIDGPVMPGGIGVE